MNTNEVIGGIGHNQNKNNMSNEEILEKIRQDRPTQVIHEVISFKENEYGFYDVKVDMETMFFESKILHAKHTLPYPTSEYEKLSEKDQFEWRFNNY
jgi:hypothetical protein